MTIQVTTRYNVIKPDDNMKYLVCPDGLLWFQDSYGEHPDKAIVYAARDVAEAQAVVQIVNRDLAAARELFPDRAYTGPSITATYDGAPDVGGNMWLYWKTALRFGGPGAGLTVVAIAPKQSEPVNSK